MASPLNFFARASGALVGTIAQRKSSWRHGRAGGAPPARTSCPRRPGKRSCLAGCRRSSWPDRPRPKRPIRPRSRPRFRCAPAWRPQRPRQQRIQLRIQSLPRRARSRRLPSPGRESAARPRPSSPGSRPRGKRGAPRRGRGIRTGVCGTASGSNAVELLHAIPQIGAAVGSARHHLNPVAGGDDHRLFHAGMRSQALHRLRQPRLGNGELLAHLHGCGLVIHADDDQVHDAETYVRG